MTNSTRAKNLSLKGESSFRAFAELVGIISRARSQHEIDTAGRQLLDLARVACIAREEQIWSEASKLVMRLPVSQRLHCAADYYRIILQEEKVGARSALVRLADSVPLGYRARVTHHIGFGYEIEGDFAEAARYYLEAAAVATDRDYLSQFYALAGLAYIRSEDGDNAGAVANFEALFPMVSALSQVYPALYAEHLNNFAVVLSKAGMTKRAERAINAALASPFAARFPEWRETAREIEEAARSEPHRSAPTLKIAVATLPVRHKEPRLRIKRQPGLPFICIVRFDLTILQIPLWVWGRYVVSQLDRYVKIARVRAPPVSL